MDMPVIVCRCGRSLGDLFQAYRAIRVKKIAAAAGALPGDIPPTKIKSSIANLKIELGDELDKLGLPLDCCRTIFTTQALASELA